MADIVDPMAAFLSFGPAMAEGLIDPQPSRTDPNLLVLRDDPMGKPRLSFAHMENDEVTALALIAPAEPVEGKPCFQIGYAVAEHLRGEGRGKAIAQAAIKDFTKNIGYSNISTFYLEAMIDIENAASRKIAEFVIGGTPKETIEHPSGKPAVQYMRKMEADSVRF